jgi:hypothetical protein
MEDVLAEPPQEGVMHRRVGLLAELSVLALGSGGLAQAPSPEPPPRFGGRVEMPEHGFAVTVPDDWVALDLAVDEASRLEAAASFVGPDAGRSRGTVRPLPVL